jgi:hypothetical protein
LIEIKVHAFALGYSSSERTAMNTAMNADIVSRYARSTPRALGESHTTDRSATLPQPPLADCSQDGRSYSNFRNF